MARIALEGIRLGRSRADSHPRWAAVYTHDFGGEEATNCDAALDFRSACSHPNRPGLSRGGGDDCSDACSPGELSTLTQNGMSHSGRRMALWRSILCPGLEFALASACQATQGRTAW